MSAHLSHTVYYYSVLLLLFTLFHIYIKLNETRLTSISRKSKQFTFIIPQIWATCRYILLHISGYIFISFDICCLSPTTVIANSGYWLSGFWGVTVRIAEFLRVKGASRRVAAEGFYYKFQQRYHLVLKI